MPQSPNNPAFYMCLQSLYVHKLYVLWGRGLVPPISEPTRTTLAALEVLYAPSAEIRGSVIPKPPRFTLWYRISLRSALISCSSKSAGRKASLRASSFRCLLELIQSCPVRYLLLSSQCLRLQTIPLFTCVCNRSTYTNFMCYGVEVWYLL